MFKATPAGGNNCRARAPEPSGLRGLRVEDPGHSGQSFQRSVCSKNNERPDPCGWWPARLVAQEPEGRCRGRRLNGSINEFSEAAVGRLFLSPRDGIKRARPAGSQRLNGQARGRFFLSQARRASRRSKSFFVFRRTGPHNFDGRSNASAGIPGQRKSASIASESFLNEGMVGSPPVRPRCARTLGEVAPSIGHIY